MDSEIYNLNISPLRIANRYKLIYWFKKLGNDSNVSSCLLNEVNKLNDNLQSINSLTTTMYRD